MLTCPCVSLPLRVSAGWRLLHLQLFKAAADRNVYMGRVCGSGVCAEPEAIEESMATAITNGCRLVCVHYMTSDLTYVGAAAATAPFWKACARTGF